MVSAASRPNTAPGCFCVMRARARVPGGTVAAVVTSPAPTSSVERAGDDRVQVHDPGRYATAPLLEDDLAVAGPIAAVLLDAIAARAAVDDVGAAADRADRVVPRPPRIRSRPKPPTSVSLPSPPMSVSSPRPPSISSAPRPPTRRSSPVRPKRASTPAAAVEAVAAAGALEEVVAAAPGQPVGAVRADDPLVRVGPGAARVAQLAALHLLVRGRTLDDLVVPRDAARAEDVGEAGDRRRRGAGRPVGDRLAAEEPDTPGVEAPARVGLDGRRRQVGDVDASHRSRRGSSRRRPRACRCPPRRRGSRRRGRRPARACRRRRRRRGSPTRCRRGRRCRGRRARAVR